MSKDSSSGGTPRLSQNTPSLSQGADSQAIDIYYNSGGFDRKGRYHDRNGKVPNFVVEEKESEKQESAPKEAKLSLKRKLSEEESEAKTEESPVKRQRPSTNTVSEVDFLRSQLAEREDQIKKLQDQVKKSNFENQMLRSENEKLKSQSPEGSPKKGGFVEKTANPLRNAGGWSSSQFPQGRKH